jgi:hypothetical protein
MYDCHASQLHWHWHWDTAQTGGMVTLSASDGIASLRPRGGGCPELRVGPRHSGRLAQPLDSRVCESGGGVASYFAPVPEVCTSEPVCSAVCPPWCRLARREPVERCGLGGILEIVDKTFGAERTPPDSPRETTASYGYVLRLYLVLPRVLGHGVGDGGGETATVV